MKPEQTKKTHGVKCDLIPIQLKQLLENCKFWIENKTFSPEEISIRFKHGLTSIHIFQYGNERHSRLMCNIMMRQVYYQPLFTWGQKFDKNEAHSHYTKALKKADIGEFEQLIKYAQS